MDYRNRQLRVTQALTKRRLDAILVTHLPNIRYLCGFTGSSGAFVIHRGKKAVLFTDGRYTQQAQQEVTGAKVHITPTNALIAAGLWLSNQGNRGKVGFEADHMSVSVRAAFGKAAGGINLRPVSGLVEHLRMVKEPAEITQIRDAVNLASSVFDGILPDIRAGVTEASLAAKIEYMCRRMGAEGMSFNTLIAAGARSALPHGVASQCPLPASGFVIFDFGVILGGYCSDMTRTVHLGRPDKASKAIYQAVLEAQLAGIQSVIPGVKSSQVDCATRKVLEKAGLARYFTHSTGHGVGIEIHERPGLRKAPNAGIKKVKTSRDAGETLLPGMVVTIEPGVYMPGKGGVRIEDMVLVTDKGCEVLTPTRKDLIVV